MELPKVEGQTLTLNIEPVGKIPENVTAAALLEDLLGGTIQRCKVKENGEYVFLDADGKEIERGA